MTQPAYPPRLDSEAEAKRLIRFIEKTFQEAGKSRALIALSGGVDSATALLLTTRALKPQNVFVLHLPAKTSKPAHLKQSQALVKKAQLPTDNFSVIPISGSVQKIWNGIKRESIFHQQHITQTCQSGLPKPKRQEIAHLIRLRLANIAARARMIVIYDQAKLLDALVVGTENFSEHLLGYYTRYGDEASDLEPIKHLFKTQVYQLAQHLKVPQEIIQEEPTAGLWPGQTDQAELGFSYQQADPILYLFEHGKTKEAIVKLGFNRTLVNRVISQVKNNQYKLQTPYTLKS